MITMGEEHEHLTTRDRPGEPSAIVAGDVVVLEVVKDGFCHCVVMTGSPPNDGSDMSKIASAPHKDDYEAVEAISDAIDAVEEALTRYGAIEAMQVKGAWRPSEPALRPQWSRHLMDCNTQKLRAAANDRKAKRQVA